ncbi:MAG: STT3 domain-containing protein [Candidatus Binatia bacterium]
MWSGKLPSAALLLLAAAIVLYVRLAPLSLSTVPVQARMAVRGQLAARPDVQAAASRAPADPARMVEYRERVIDQWIAAHSAQFERDVAAETDRLTAAVTYEDSAGRRWPLLGDYDSYAWLRAARNQLRHGTVCDAVADGQCRDMLTLAPHGTAMIYGRTPHVVVIAALHRIATWFDPHLPLPVTAFLVPVIVGVLGVIPAFAIARRFAGPIGGFFGAVISGLHPMFLLRSIGSDNDVWNVVLPLYMAWALIAALQARTPRARLIGATLGGAIGGLHAAEWRGWQFGFAVAACALSGAIALHAARWALAGRSARVWRAPGARRAAVVLIAYALTTAIVASAFGRGDALSFVWDATAPTTAQPAPHDRSADWPSTFAYVGELSLPSLGAIAAQSYGFLLFFVGWLGMLLLLLPRGRWRTGHYVVLIGGTLLYRYLLTATGLSHAALVALLALPLAAAALVLVREGNEADAEDAAAGMIVVAWLLAALLMSYRGMRFILLLAGPFGIAASVAIGRFHAWLVQLTHARRPRSSAIPGALATAVVLALAVIPIRVGYQTAASYVPAIDRAWAETLERLRTTSPPDAIVNTWWDYGYWTKFLGERRVSADGGTLLTHVPHWLARAQLSASEAEAVGLLRMLNCGSDAQPYPEGALGAYAKLVQHGLDPVAAYGAVLALAAREQPAAEEYLAARGLDAPARADVLSATHCQPPPSYLILSDRQPTFPGWWQMGTWDPRRAYIAGPLRALGERQAVAELTSELGYDEPEAHRLYQTARSLPDGARARFVAPGGRLITKSWAACTPAPGGELRCPIGAVDGYGAWVEAVAYPAAAPRNARIITRARDGRRTESAPGALSIATAAGVDTVRATATADSTALLIDPERSRVLLGTPSAIDALFTRLMYLDGRGVTRFRKVDDRTSARGQRVVTWAIDWNGAAVPAATAPPPEAAQRRE